MVDRGKLAIGSTPDKAQVTFDGELKSWWTPWTVSTPIGPHTVKLTRPGYKDWGPRSYSVQKDKTITISASLETTAVPPEPPEPPKPEPKEPTQLYIKTLPTTAAISVDGVDTGRLTNYRFETTPGFHTITLEKPKYKPYTAAFEAKEGQTTEYTITLEEIEVPVEIPEVPTKIEDVPLLTERLPTAISLMLTGDVPDWLKKWDGFLDWLTGTFGTEFPAYEQDKLTGEFKRKPKGKKVLFFISMKAPVTALAKAAAGAIAKGTAESIIAQARSQPAQLADDFLKLAPAQKIAVHEALQKAGTIGRSASDAIFRITAPQLVKAGATGLTKTLSSIWKPIALVGAVVGLKEAVSWFHKELPEVIGFPLRDLIRDKEWEKAAEIFPTYEKLTGITANFLRTTGFEAILGLPIWQGYADAYEAQTATWKQQIAEGLAAGQPETTISVATNADPALATITTIFLEKVTPFTTGIAPGRFDLTIEKEGYMPRTVTVIVKENQNNPVTVELQAIPPEISPRAGRLEIAVFNKKIGVPILASFYINDRLEKATAHVIVLDMVPGAYEIRVEAAGYKVFEDTVQVDENVTTKVRADMEKFVVPPEEPPPVVEPPEEPPDKVAEKGRLEVTANIEARIFLGGEDTGKNTPAAFELTQGIYTVSLAAEGYWPRSTTSLVKSGEVSRVSLEMVPVEAPAPTRRLARVSISSSPVAAKILVNGVWTKQYTPDSVLLEPGDYEISLAKTGYKIWTTPLRLVEE